MNGVTHKSINSHKSIKTMYTHEEQIILFKAYQLLERENIHGKSIEAMKAIKPMLADHIDSMGMAAKNISSFGVLVSFLLANRHIADETKNEFTFRMAMFEGEQPNDTRFYYEHFGYPTDELTCFEFKDFQMLIERDKHEYHFRSILINNQNQTQSISNIKEPTSILISGWLSFFNGDINSSVDAISYDFDKICYAKISKNVHGIGLLIKHLALFIKANSL